MIQSLAAALARKPVLSLSLHVVVAQFSSLLLSSCLPHTLWDFCSPMRNAVAADGGGGGVHPLFTKKPIPPTSE